MSGDLGLLVGRVASEVSGQRKVHLELFAAAYMQATDIDPRQAGLVEERLPDGRTRWYFERLASEIAPLCAVVCPCGRYGEPLACGYPSGHAGPHSWASLPTFVEGNVVVGQQP